MESNQNKFKEALNQSVPQWDESGMWDSIEETLPTDNLRRRWFFWLMPGLGIAVIGLAAWWMFLIPQQSESVLSSDSLSQVELDKDSSDKKRKEKDLKKNLTLDEKVGDEKNPKDTQATLQQAKKNVQSLRSTEVIQRTATVQGNQSNATLSQALPQIAQDKLYETGIKISSSPFASQNKIVASQSRDEQLQVGNSLQKDQLATLGYLDRIEYSFLHKQSKEKNENPHIQNDNLSELETKSTQSSPRHSITTNFGVMKTLRSFGTASERDWMTAKESQEQVLETVDLSIQYQRMLTRNLEVGIGIGYTQVNERLTWRDTVLAKRDTSYTSSLQTVSTQSNIIKNETPNAYQTVYVPLSIGYVVTRGKWIYTTTVGANVSFRNRHRGRLLTTNLSVSDPELNKDLINNRIGIQSLNASIKGGYQLKEKLYVSAGLRYQLGIQNRLTDSSTQLKYGGYGLQFGLQYLFH